MAIITWSGTGLASAGANWVGGVAPSINDTAKYDGTSVNACTWDIAQVAGVETTVAYTGVITQSVNTILTTLTIVTNATQDFVTAGFNLDIDGDYNESGAGNGLTPIGGRIRFGGNVNISGTNHSDLAGRVEMFGGTASPLSAKTHNVDFGFQGVLSNGLTQFVIDQNQEVIFDNHDSIRNFIIESNTKISGNLANGRRTLFITAISGPASALWGAAAGGKQFLLHFLGSAIEGADYGDCDITFQGNLTINQGDYITTEDVNFSTNNLTNTFTISVLIKCRDMTMGGTNPQRATTIIQQSGSQFILSGNMLLRSDDTIEVTKWERQAGVLDSSIGGNFTVQADAALDFANDTSTITVGGITSIDTAAICNFGLTTLRHSGDIKNAGFSNVFNELVSETSATPIVLLDDIGANRWSFTGTGDIDIAAATNSISLRADGPQMVGADSVNWVFDGGGINFLVSSSATYNGLVTIPSANYKSHTELRRSGTGNRTLRILGDVTFKNVTPRDFTVDCNGFNLTCDSFKNSADAYEIALSNGQLTVAADLLYSNALNAITGAGVISIGGDLQHTAGTIDVSNKSISVVGNQDLSLGATFDLGSGTIEVFGNFIPLGDVDLGSGTYICHGTFDLSGANSVTSSGATVIMRGSGSNIFDISGLTNINIFFQRSGGDLTIQQVFNITGTFRETALGNNTVTWLAGATFAANVIETVGNTGSLTTNVSSVPATTYQITVTLLGNINRYSAWADCNIVGAYIRVDLLTGADNGGNDVTAPDGIDFANYQADQLGLSKFKTIGPENLQGLVKPPHPLIP